MDAINNKDCEAMCNNTNDNNATECNESITMLTVINTTGSTDGSDVTSDNGGKKRETWGRSIDFLFSCIGGAVGFGNMWRFPYLCYKNGGGAFLIPYFVCLVCASLPLFILEVNLGQFMSSGGWKAWNIVPLFQGVGMTSTVIMFYINCYYNMILSWIILYFFHSFSSHLPWDRCDGPWNTPQCTQNFSQIADHSSNSSAVGGHFMNSSSSIKAERFNQSFILTEIVKNTSAMVTPTISSFVPSNVTMSDPVTEFWERKVLGISEGLDEMGEAKWDLALCLVTAWVCVYLCICKGIKGSGKVMYVTAPAPYVFMVIIIIRNATLPGAADGVWFYLKPNISKLADIPVWADAGKQTIFSSCVGQGIAVTLGSYNKFKHNSVRDSLIISFVNAFTSFFAGFLVFTILGFMAHNQGRLISDVAESGPGLVFIAYPKAVAQMPLPQLWSVLFFLMLIMIGLDSQIVGVETVITAIVDQFPSVLRRGHRKEVFVAAMCVLQFLIGVPLFFNGGFYVFQLIDFYCGGRVLMFVAFFEVFSIAAVYGYDRFLCNIEMMVGQKWVGYVRRYLTVTWCITAPSVCLGLFIVSSMNHQDLSYSRPNKSVYYFPVWSDVIGWMLTMSCVMWIPLFAVYKFYRYGLSKEVFKLMMVPYALKPHQKRPQDKYEKCLRSLE